MSKIRLSRELQGEGQKPLALFSFCVAETGVAFENRIPIRQILPLCHCDEHERVQRYAMICVTAAAVIPTENTGQLPVPQGQAKRTMVLPPSHRNPNEGGCKRSLQG